VLRFPLRRKGPNKLPNSSCTSPVAMLSSGHSEEHEVAVAATCLVERLFQLMQELCRRTRTSFPVRRQGTGKELPP
jgi:hypothetical protein